MFSLVILYIDEVRTSKFISRKIKNHLSLETREQVDKEGVTHRVGNLEDPLLGQQGLDLVPGDDVTLLQRFDGKIFASIFVPCQYNLK